MKTLAPFALAGSALLALTLAGGAQAQDAARDMAADPADAGWLTVGDGVGVLPDPVRVLAARDAELRISRDGSRVIAGDALLPAEGADYARAPRLWPVDRGTGPARTEDAGVIRITEPGALVTAGPAQFTLPPVVTAIPEPQTYAMLLAGLGVVGALAARRRRA